jgi:hypothetical protein
MGMEFHFDSGVRFGAQLPEFSEAQVKNEPMLFRCSVESARELGGDITRAFLDALNYWGEDGIIDTRVHMLMPGWYPCIPGWHHDDVPRSREDRQPNYVNPEYRAEHAMALINGDICPTEFAIGKCTMPDVPLGQTIYKIWNDYIVGLIEYGTLERVEAPSNRLVFFDCDTFHQGAVTRKKGWRWFGRITRGSKLKVANEVRRQVQVYMPFPTQGW